ncbi:hypothetical protein QFC20_007566 [Naganishia adeliensis]|uniref:Uncharacterized protein n=1 Tax=Naganishia adeliensis TaxID=92952 RepID=A0ACC2UYA2_9TREE|nr:hypothetical protein QFC20_007566 [Naganishia adeliensis]
MSQIDRFDPNQTVSRTIEKGINDLNTFSHTAVYTGYLVWCNIQKSRRNELANDHGGSERLSSFSKLQPLYNLVKATTGHPDFGTRRDALIGKLERALSTREFLEEPENFTEQEKRDLAQLKRFHLPDVSLDTIAEEVPGGDVDVEGGEHESFRGSGVTSGKCSMTDASSGVTNRSVRTSAPSSVLTNGSQSPNRKAGGNDKDHEQERKNKGRKP